MKPSEKRESEIWLPPLNHVRPPLMFRLLPTRFVGARFSNGQATIASYKGQEVFKLGRKWEDSK